MQQGNLGLCQKCRKKVPADYVLADGKVYLRKDCPDCGPNQSLVSSDAAAWRSKRDLWKYDESKPIHCSMQCEGCKTPHHPTVMFVDVTNRCNMNCPICIANISGMGFEFHPPIDYFEKIFKTIGQFEPTPMIELFGGEPTVREDLIDIINLGRKYGLRPRVVTNGLRLADEAYCKKLCDARARFRLGLDGRSPEIYTRLRKNPKAYEKKLKALENLKKYSRRKNAILCCAAKGVNDQHIGDLIECCHENRDFIDELGLLPLTDNWEPGNYQVETATTPEDVEHMVEESVSGGQVEFIPAGVGQTLRLARSFIKKKARSGTLMFGGVHPNCESMTVLVSMGQEYRSANHYLKIPLSRIAEEILDRGRKLDAKLVHLDPEKRFDRLRAKWLILKTFGPLILRSVSLKRVLTSQPLSAWLRVIAGVLTGKKLQAVVKQHMNLPCLLRVAMLPFEEYHNIDSARLSNCKAAFAYVDADDDQVKTIPACVWTHYRNKVLKKASDKYGIANKTPKEQPVNA